MKALTEYIPTFLILFEKNYTLDKLPEEVYILVLTKYRLRQSTANSHNQGVTQ